MAFKPLKVGIIGYAHYMRTNFVLHLRECPAVEIVGVYNRSEERRKAAEDDGFWATSDLERFFKIPGLEAVIIGSANATHKEFSIRAARQGLHVLCEKPMALTVQEADEMVKEAEKAGIVTHVNHMSPYTEAYQTFKIKAEDFAGKVLHVANRHTRAFGFWIQGARHQNVAHPEASGGWTYHHMCHALDEVCILLNTTRATRVYHVMQKSCEDCPSEELVNALIHFDNGATAFISDGLSIGGYQDTFVQGTKGDVRLYDNTVTVTVPGPGDRTQRPGSLTAFSRTYPVPPMDKMIVTIGAKFTQAIRGGKNELLSFRFVADQYRILEAMKQSALSGKAVEPQY
jgi:UDP-N-acetylglucosamine 3-dehydrogenase